VSNDFFVIDVTGEPVSVKNQTLNSQRYHVSNVDIVEMTFDRKGWQLERSLTQIRDMKFIAHLKLQNLEAIIHF
jgi:hypothetical protein